MLELDILKAFRDFCDSHGLRYYLCGGTLIGAIRHHGFIPWDDDIDVMMPRPDYLKFINLNKNGWLDNYRRLDHFSLNRDPLGTNLRVYDTRTSLIFENFVHPKEFGCWIDVFPLDGLSVYSPLRFIHCRCLRLVQDLLILNDTKLGGERRSKIITMLQYGLAPILPLVRLVGHERWIRLMNKLSILYPYSNAKYVGVVSGRAIEKEAMRKCDMEPALWVDFENDKFTTMANYHEYLTNLYGNYMLMPNKEKRKSRHLIQIYWKKGEHI